MTPFNLLIYTFYAFLPFYRLTLFTFQPSPSFDPFYLFTRFHLTVLPFLPYNLVYRFLPFQPLTLLHLLIYTF